MKNIFTILFTLFLLQTTTAQIQGALVEHPPTLPNFNWKQEAKRTILPASLSFASGVFGGLHEALLWRKDVFFKRFPNADRQYWDNSLSWENKYWRRCPVQLSDAYHMTQSAHNLLLFSAGVNATIPISSSWRKPGKWWHPIARIAMQSAAISAGYYLGSELTFSQFFKR